MNPHALTGIEAAIWAAAYAEAYVNAYPAARCADMADCAVRDFRQARPEGP